MLRREQTLTKRTHKNVHEGLSRGAFLARLPAPIEHRVATNPAPTCYEAAMHPWVVVTGAARGIGRGIVELLLKEGHSVAALDVARESLAELSRQASEARLLTLYCDVGDEAEVRAAFESIGQRTKTLCGLVNNAGIADPTVPPIEELSLEQWRRVLRTNLDGVFLCSKHATPLLRAGRGSIVNIASTRALQSEANTEAYAASKGGVVAFTHALAMSLGPEVRVNAISPGWIDTSTAQPGAAPAEHREIDHRQHPAGRIGEPKDIAALVSYLLSEHASFITGQNFVVDGGMTKKMIYVE